VTVAQPSAITRTARSLRGLRWKPACWQSTWIQHMELLMICVRAACCVQSLCQSGRLTKHTESSSACLSPVLCCVCVCMHMQAAAPAPAAPSVRYGSLSTSELKVVCKERGLSTQGQVSGTWPPELGHLGTLRQAALQPSMLEVTSCGWLEQCCWMCLFDTLRLCSLPTSPPIEAHSVLYACSNRVQTSAGLRQVKSICLPAC